ncbi:MAG TPA: hypothetical protein VGA78_07485 [Gemmatimonadales bacterium]
MGTAVVIGILPAEPLMAQEHAPPVLEIYRDSLTQGSGRAYRAVEEDAARICADLNCPHPHLAIESLTGPKEVWWLNAFDSEAHRQQLVNAYAGNRALTMALEGISKRKEGLVGKPVDLFVTYRPDLSGGATWKLRGTRFFVVTVTTQDRETRGSVFEAPDGTRFVLRPAATSDVADALAAAAGPETTVFAVRPYWGMPARDWMAADPEFWSSNPMAKAK